MYILGQIIGASFIGYTIFSATSGTWEPWVLGVYFGAFILEQGLHLRKFHGT